MKITLINPPFNEQDSVGASRSIKYVLNIIPPLGLAYLAAAVRQHDFQVNIIDFTIERFHEDIFKKIVHDNPDIIGITASTPTFESTKYIARRIKELLPQKFFIIGGAHITAMPYDTMETGIFDVGVLGEGEKTLLDLLIHIQKKGLAGLEAIKGIAYKQDGRVVITPRREFIEDLDILPYPARDLLPALSRYRPTPASYRRLPLGIIITSRGCPHQCVFCDRAVFGNVYRQRSAENVLGEIEELTHEYGAKEIRFFDDCFTLDKERTYKICAGLKRRNPGIPWTCLTTVTSVTEDLLKEMKSSGCWQILFGLESGDEKMLGLLKKGATLEQNINAIRWAKEAGLSVRADFIVGTPGETEESLKKTLNFALDMDLDYAHFNKFIPFPGAELYKFLSSKGYNFDFTRGCSILDHSALLYVPEGMTKKEFQEFLDTAFKKFYLRPGYMIKRLLSIRTREEFIGQLKGLFAISGL